MAARSPAEYRADHGLVFRYLSQAQVEVRNMARIEIQTMGEDAGVESQARVEAYKFAADALLLAQQWISKVEQSAENDPRCVNA